MTYLRLAFLSISLALSAQSQEIYLLTDNNAEPIGRVKDVRQLSATTHRVLALDVGGAVHEWRRATRRWQVIPGPEGIKKLAAGAAHTLLLLNDGSVWTAGQNTMGQLGDGTIATRATFKKLENLPEIADIDAGPDYSLATDTAGRTWAWGANWTNIVPTESRKAILTPQPTLQSKQQPRVATAILANRDTVTLSAAAMQVSSTAGTGSLTVTANEPWTAASSNSWLTVSPASGTTSQTLTYSFSANTATAGRLATITVAGKTFTVSQSGATGQFNPWGTVRYGTLRRIAGANMIGSWGDGGPAYQAVLNTPFGAAVDHNGNVFIADSLNNKIRRIDAVTFNMSTVVGTGAVGSGGDGGPATAAQLSQPRGVAIDPMGNLFIADYANGRIRKVDAATGTISTVNAQLSGPSALVLDSARNLYIADELASSIRKIDAVTSTLTAVAGIGVPGFSGDGGPATAATLAGCTGVAVDSAGNIYIADSSNNRIRKVDATSRNISTVAGTGTRGFSGDGGNASSAQLNSPTGVAVDSAGNFYLADRFNRRIRRVDVNTGAISTVAGNGFSRGPNDFAAAIDSPMEDPIGVTLDGVGNLYITDYSDHRITFIDLATTSVTVDASAAVLPQSAGSSTLSLSISPAVAPWYATSSASWLTLAATSGNSSGTLGFNFSANNAIASRSAVITVNGIATAFVQSGATVTLSANSFTLTPAAFSGSIALTVSPAVTWSAVSSAPWLSVATAAGSGSQTVNFSATANTGPAGRVATIVIAGRNVTVVQPAANGASTPWGLATYGLIRTVAGSGTPAFAGDGTAAAFAMLNGPQGLKFDANGNIIFADTVNSRIRRVDATTGVITTIAGSGATFGGCYDALATASGVGSPRDVAFDSQGNLFYSDFFANQVCRIDAVTGRASRIAGQGSAGRTGNGGPAATAYILNPNGIAIDSSGNLFFTESFYGIRRVDAVTGVISHVAGGDISGFGGDNGPAATAVLNFPFGLAFSPAGDLYVSDKDNHRIRKITIATGVITTIAGTGAPGFSGDGSPATAAQLDSPSHLSFDAAGNLYFVDRGNNRVRKISAASGVISTVAGGGASFGDNGPANAAQLANPTGIAVDGNGNIAISDATSNRIRFVDFSTPPGTQFAPTLFAGTPATTSTTTQTFTITARDANGASDINNIFFLISSSPTIASGSCHGYFNRNANSVYLYNDSLSTLSGVALGSADTAQNSQCAVIGASSSVSLNGTDLALNITLRRQGAYTNGPLKLYTWITDAANSGTGWVQVSDWSAAPAQAPSLAAASPAAATLLTQAFTLTARDANGYADINRVYFLLNTDTNIPANSCHGYYDRPTNAVYLYNDALTALNGQNSQCAINSFSTTNTVTDLVLTLNLTRKGAYATGAKNLYAWIVDASNLGTGWVLAATSNPNTQQPPSLLSSTPASLTNLSDTISITARDPNGASDISRIYFLLNVSTAIPANTCHGFYDRASNTVAIYNDGLTGFTPANSQCAVSSFTIATTATDLTLNLTMTRLGAYSTGFKNFYVWITDTANAGTGWQQILTWNIGNVVPQAPTLAASSPSVVSANAFQAFSITARDANGASDINRIYFLLNDDTSVPSYTCHGFYDRATDAVYLYNDTLTALNTANSQCAVFGVSTSTTSTDVVLNFSIERRGAYYVGPKNLYTWITDKSDLGTGWQQVVTWNLGPGPTPPPVLVAVTPSSSASATETFAITTFYTSRIYFLLNTDSASIPTNGCHGFYDRATNTVSLYNNALSGFSPPNSQCAVVNFSTVQGQSSLTLNLTLSRLGTYLTGNKTLYVWLTGANNSGTGWVQAATWPL